MRYLLFMLTFILSCSLMADQGFEKNLGQVMDSDRSINKDVLYTFNQHNLQITLRKEGFSYELKHYDTTGFQRAVNENNTDFNFDAYIERIDFIFPQPPIEITSDDNIESKIKLYNENGEFRSHVTKRVLYKGVADGFDIEFLIIDNQFKYNIIKSSHGKLENFFLEIRTAGKLSLEDEFLKISTNQGQINENIPVSYLGENKTLTDIIFSLEGNLLRFTSKENTIGQQLIIDPVPDLVWSTFIGGEEYDLTTSSVVSEDGFIYITGITTSFNNISTSGAFQTNYQGDLDIFISKFSNEGDLIWSSYYGGPQSERIYNIAENNGYIYLAGSTFSNIGIITAGAHQSSIVGADDIFILKMDSTGNRIWCTYHGGNDHDFVTDMLVQNDTIFMAGHTRSFNNMTTSGVHLESYTASEAGHITLFNTDGDFLWGTYFGSEGNNSIQGIARSNNKIFVTGRTNAANGVSTLGVHQEAFSGFIDAFIAKFENNGTLIWSTYFGGDYTDIANAIVADTSGGVFIAGNTNSTNQIATSGAHQDTRLSPEQGFIAHFNKDGVRNWSTYTGGSNSDYISTLHATENAVYIGGQTLSTDEIVTIDTYQTLKGNGYDGFVQRFNYNGALTWGTYLGGVGNEDILSLSLFSNNIIITGSVDQNDAVFGKGNSYSDQYKGGVLDGFLAYICQPSPITIILIGDSLISSPLEKVDWYLEGNLIANSQYSIHPEVNGNYTAVSSMGDKCVYESESFYLSSVGVEKKFIQKKSDILIYPNPTTDYVSIEKEGLFSGKITSIEGKTYKQFEGKNMLTIDTRSLKSGVYIVHIFNHENQASKKILKL